MPNEDIWRLAHDLNNKSQSRDVAISEDVTFADFHLSPETVKGLSKCGFSRPSQIQLLTIPLGRCGFDLVVQSKAGTGKTCIFALLALESLKFNLCNSIQTLIIAPTREIAIQVHEVVSLLGSQHKHLKCCLCIGGVNVKQDRAQLSDGCQIIIGTPGRVKQLIELNIIRTHRIELFVLDEADKLMDDQFKGQIDEIYRRLPRDKQIVATSATYPDELALFIQQYMRAPQCVRIGSDISLEAIEEFHISSKAGSSTKRDVENKMRVLTRLLMDQKKNLIKCFVFTNYQARAPLLCDYLNKDDEFVQQHGQTKYLCAELSQDDRNRIFKEFRNSPEQRVLVSTDVSARGIDIRDIDTVINFDVPNDNTTYYHRIGRAGRFGRPGKAYTIVSTSLVDKALFKKSVESKRIKEYIIATND